MPLFDPSAVLNNSDLVGPQKLFGSQPSLDDAIEKHAFPRGRIVGGMRKYTGAEVNEWWDSRPTERQDRRALNAASVSAVRLRRGRHDPQSATA
jgi:predicted DNA-binding transcriptional regulator AlpA